MATERPDVLYHYCSLDTFLKIAETSTIRLCNLRKSNDSKEMQWILEQACDLTTKMVYKDSTLDVDKTLDVDGNEEDLNAKLINALIKMERLDKNPDPLERQTKCKYIYSALRSAINSETEKNTITHINTLFGNARSHAWAMCFSPYGDSLSQWRGYGDDGNGLSIGFSPSYLASIESIPERLKTLYTCGLSEVIYPGTPAEIANILGIDFNSTSLKKEAYNVAFRALSETEKLPPIFKHPSFSDEKEGRIYMMCPALEFFGKSSYFKEEECFARKFILRDMEFYIRDNRIVSFLPLEIIHMKDALRHIFIGPKAKVNIDDIKHVLFQFGYINSLNDDSIIVDQSRATYRK
jgi:hypothetical protein